MNEVCNFPARMHLAAGLSFAKVGSYYSAVQPEISEPHPDRFVEQ